SGILRYLTNALQLAQSATDLRGELAAPQPRLLPGSRARIAHWRGGCRLSCGMPGRADKGRRHSRDRGGERPETSGSPHPSSPAASESCRAESGFEELPDSIRWNG